MPHGAITYWATHTAPIMGVAGIRYTAGGVVTVSVGRAFSGVANRPATAPPSVPIAVNLVSHSVTVVSVSKTVITKITAYSHAEEAILVNAFLSQAESQISLAFTYHAIISSIISVPFLMDVYGESRSANGEEGVKIYYEAMALTVS